MLSVRVWNLQSDCDAKSVKFLENEFLRFRQLEYLAIRTTERGALRKCHKNGSLVRERLKRAIQYYLKQDDYIIFVVDSDQQQQKLTSLANEIKQIVKDCNLSNKVFFVADIQEGEFAAPTQWQRIISRFRTEVESERKQLREEWDRTVAHFHNTFADMPEEEVTRHFEEALAEVRRERT